MPDGLRQLRRAAAAARGRRGGWALPDRHGEVEVGDDEGAVGRAQEDILRPQVQVAQPGGVQLADAADDVERVAEQVAARGWRGGGGPGPHQVRQGPGVAGHHRAAPAGEGDLADQPGDVRAAAAAGSAQGVELSFHAALCGGSAGRVRRLHRHGQRLPAGKGEVGSPYLPASPAPDAIVKRYSSSVDVRNHALQIWVESSVLINARTEVMIWRVWRHQVIKALACFWAGPLPKKVGFENEAFVSNTGLYQKDWVQ